MEEDIKNMSKEELLEYLEEISQQLDNIALDQIQFAISELQFFKEDYKKLEEENSRLNKKIIDIYKYSIPTSVIQNKKDNIENEYKEALEENSTKAFILKCQLEILNEILEEGRNK